MRIMHIKNISDKIQAGRLADILDVNTLRDIAQGPVFKSRFWSVLAIIDSLRLLSFNIGSYAVLC